MAREHWEHEHALSRWGLRELEFDREMGKLSDADYQSLRASLQGRALQAMSAIEKFKDEERASNLAAISVRPKLREAAAIADEIAAMSRPQQPTIPIVSGLGSIPPPVSSPARLRRRDRRGPTHQILPAMRHARGGGGKFLWRMRHAAAR